MRCPREGDLRLSIGSGDEQVRRHTDSCARCAETVRRLKAASSLAAAQLPLLPVEAERPTANSTPVNGGRAYDDPTQALHRFKSRLERKSGMSEFGKRRMSPAWVGGVIAVALVAAVLVSPVRSAAVGLLDVFRVEKFAAITIDVSKPPMNMDSGAMLGQRTGKHGDEHDARKPDLNVFGKYSGPVKPSEPEQVASLDAASEKVGYDAASAGDSVGGARLSKVYVSKAATASYTFDTSKIRAKLDEKGVQGVNVPEQIDGKTFTLSIPSAVWVRYGTGEEGVVFAQGPSPELSIPEGVNMDYLRQDFLTLPGLPADLVAQVQAIEDWEHTLIIPLPPNGTSKEVRIEGAEGLLISDQTGEYNGVLWQRDGKLYALGGKIGSSEVLRAARAVQ